MPAIVKILLDLAVVSAAGFSVLLFHILGRPPHRGFFCDDDSIRYPFQESTVTTEMIYIVGILGPVLTIVVTEFVRGWDDDSWPIVLGRPVPGALWAVYRHLGVYFFGACLAQLSTDVAKYTVGRLRPHFLDVCRPDVDCAALPANFYVERYACTGTDANKMREARLSFPSGHASFTAYTMVYTTLYLGACVRWRRTNRLLRPFLQFWLLMMTWYTTLSRVADYKHHWSDVLCGFLLGASVALLVVFYVSDCFVKAEPALPVATQTTYSTNERR